MTDVSRTTPRRVLRRAAELGTHADCVASGIDGACDSCVEFIHESFKEFYGHVDTAEEALILIVKDILEDRKNG
jgi:hypothetical protein